MSKFEALMDRCNDLYMDLSLQYVADWKKKNNAKAMGFLPVYFPCEIIHAAGMLPVGIMGGGDQLEIIKGDAYYQSYICHIPRSVVEMGMNGMLDPLDGMIFPSICDVIRNLSGMWKMMFPNKISLYFDAPQNLNRDLGGEFLRSELQKSIKIFEGMSGNKVTDESLSKSIKLYNKNRLLIEQMYTLRAAEPQTIPTSELYLILRAGNILDVEEHNQLIKDYLDLVPKDRIRQDNSRLILKGSFCEQPPLGLIKALERSGGYIVDDDFVLGSRWLKSSLSTEGDLIKTLADAFLDDSREGAFKYNPDSKGTELVKSMNNLKADGMVFCAASFCDPGLLEQPLLQKKCEENDITYTTFQFAENTGQYGPIREQVGTFSDSIKLWGE